MHAPSRSRIALCCLALVSLLLMVAPAQADELGSGYIADFVRDFDATAKKLVDLAEAIPAEKFSWAPTEEVRTVSKSIIHVAVANYFLSQALGVPAPEGAGPDLEEKITTKAEVIAELVKSQAHVRKAAQAASGGLDEEVEVFGGKRSARGVVMLMAGHNHEHLGQLIVYARSIGVVPPWSRPAQ